MDFKNRIIDYGVKPASEFKANPLNFREHPANQLAGLRGALSEIGWIGVVVENRTTGQLIDGHARIKEALDAGNQSVPYVAVDLSEEQERLALATFDPIGMMAKQKAADLRELLSGISAGQEALATFLANLGQSVGLQKAPGGGGDDFDCTPQEGETRSHLGELWQLGEHRLFCGDSTGEILNVIDWPIDAIFCDPPYGLNIVATNGYVGGGEAYNIPFGGRKRLGSANASKPFGSKRVRGTDGASHIVAAGKYLPIEGDQNTELASKSYPVLNERFPKAVQIWWGANHYSTVFPASSCWLVWDKENTGNFADCELAWTNQAKAARLFKHQWNGMLRESERGIRRVHPTQKPIALVEWCLSLFPEAATVLDPFAGSGISIIAAERMNRRVWACEIEPLYCDVILRRWEAETGKQAELCNESNTCEATTEVKGVAGR